MPDTNYETEWDPTQLVTIADAALVSGNTAAFADALALQTLITASLRKAGLQVGPPKLSGRPSLTPAGLHAALSSGHPPAGLELFAEVTGLPGQTLADIFLPPGSLLLVPPGADAPQGLFSVIASPTVLLGVRLAALSLAPDPALGAIDPASWFLRAVEAGPAPRGLAARFARQFMEPDGKLSPGVFLLTLVFPASSYAARPEQTGATVLVEGPMDPDPGKPTPAAPVERTNGDLTENFSLADLNPHNFPLTATHKANLKIVAKNLQVLRDSLGQPLTINSGYRSPAYNKSIGGVGNSQHTEGKASDIKVAGMKPSALKAAIEKLIAQGKMRQGGIGLYPTFVHYDTRGTRARWNG